MDLTGEQELSNGSSQNVITSGSDDNLVREVEKVLHNNIRDTGFDFHCEGFGSTTRNGVHYYYSGANRDARAQDLCKRLFAQIDDPVGHFTRLDQVFSQLLECNLKPSQPASAVAERACRRLRRLPTRPPELVDARSLSNVQYTVGGQLRSSSGPVWEELQVVSLHNTNTIRIALFLEILGVSAMATSVFSFVNTIAESLEAASLLAAKAEPGLCQQKWFIVRAFLWTAWQRSSILLMSQVLYQDLCHGESGDIRTDLALRRTFPSPGLSVRKMSRKVSGLGKSKYMCSWAFELLRNDPIFTGMDFRLFHQRYIDVFGNRSGRCIQGSDEPCNGKLPGHCQRFVGGVVQDQSAHDSDCPKTCIALVWDEASYRAVIGARAVSLDQTDPEGNVLRYCKASEKTIAISHVWSHGQGGRPEAGLNGCLHHRYASIARSQGCDSYWMDTACIPENHQLRTESIQRINEIFELSKLTVVCDRDLMEIDIEHITLRLRESILAIILVCDWNIRAWTFLEAFKGRHAIYLLCKNNRILSLKETIDIVCGQGRLDIAMLFLAVPHLLPADKLAKMATSRATKPLRPGMLDIRFRKPNSLSVETGGSLLSHRAASREGDDIVIWSLILNEALCDTAEAFWRSRQDTTLSTGFLISSTPRLSIPGFSWAPCRPTSQTLTATTNNDQSYHLAFDGAESEYGNISAKGFSAFWLIYEFNGGRRKRLHFSTWNPKKLLTSGSINIQRVCTLYLQKYRNGVILRPISDPTFDTPAEYRGDFDGILVAVCGSNDNGNSWEWKGVYEWDTAEPLPKFTRSRERLLIA